MKKPSALPKIKRARYQVVNIFVASVAPLLFLLAPASHGQEANAANSDAPFDIPANLPSISESVIEQGALDGLSGITSINITSGDGNIQQNSAAIAVSQDNGYSYATVDPNQDTDNSLLPDHTQNLSAHILSGAFADGLGVMMVNQSSGTGNVQLNGTAIAIGGPGSEAAVELSDMELAAEASATGVDVQQKTVDDKNSIVGEISLAADAFSRAQGIVQLNQVVGNGNRTVNALSMTIKNRASNL